MVSLIDPQSHEESENKGRTSLVQIGRMNLFTYTDDFDVSGSRLP